MKTNNFEFKPNNTNYQPISYDNERKWFVVEGSDLGWNFDVNDILKIKNIDNNNTIEFKLSKTKTDDEGDILVWIFKSIKGAKFPVEFHIIND